MLAELPGEPGIDGDPALGEEEALLEALPLDCELLRELLRDEELLEDELLEGIELLLVGICTDGGWLLVEVVRQPPSNDSITTGSSNWRVFTACTCRSK